jgi:hypothetical protein
MEKTQITSAFSISEVLDLLLAMNSVTDLIKMDVIMTRTVLLQTGGPTRRSEDLKRGKVVLLINTQDLKSKYDGDRGTS